MKEKKKEKKRKKERKTEKRRRKKEEERIKERKHNYKIIRTKTRFIFKCLDRSVFILSGMGLL